MQNQTQAPLIEPDLAEAALTLAELAASCAVPADWLLQHVQDGLVEPLTGEQNQWRFSYRSRIRVQRILVLERDFDAVPELAALVADMQEEIAELKRRLYQAGIE